MISRTNIIIALLIVFNLVLLGALFGYIYVFLAISLLTNIGLLLFVKHVFSEQNVVLDEIETLHKDIEGFRRHLEQLHELETYYGDDTLQRLIMHARSINNDLVDFQERHSYAKAQEGYHDASTDDDTEEDAQEESGKTDGIE